MILSLVHIHARIMREIMTLLDGLLAVSTASLGCLAGKRRQEGVENETWVWALRLGPGF